MNIFEFIRILLLCSIRENRKWYEKKKKKTGKIKSDVCLFVVKPSKLGQRNRTFKLRLHWLR